MAIDTAALLVIINHVFLPPRLPCGEDEADFEPGLVKLLLSSLRKYHAASVGNRQRLKDAISAVENFSTSRDAYAAINDISLTRVLGNVAYTSATVSLRVVAQNAGLLIRKSSDAIIFEAFELSPSNKSVIGTRGRLQRQFPGVAVAIPLSRFNEKGFQSAIASTITKMSHQQVGEMKSHAKKAGQTHVEDRETTNPALVTELLASILCANGLPADVASICKNTREEVMWDQGNKLPWRRSATWLLLRVSLQLTLSRPTQESCRADSLYKRFMVSFMSDILEEAHSHLHVESEMFYAMNAKVAQRVLKLDISAPDPCLSSVHATVSKTKHMLDSRWRSVMEEEEQPLVLKAISKSNVSRDLFANLPDLDHFLDLLVCRQPNETEATFHPTSQLLDFSPQCFDSIRDIGNSGTYLEHNLVVFEEWVEEHLDHWLASVLYHANTSDKLRKVMGLYHDAALHAYREQPESNSIMLLTVFELWIAIDKSAVAVHSLIAEYDPEVPTDVWKSLLLRSKTDMQRLFEAEKYLERRINRASVHRRYSIYTNFGCAQSFSVRYFASSTSHRTLLSKIEEKATQDRADACKEFEALKNRYKQLMDRFDSTNCDSEEIQDKDGQRRSRHRPSCKRCDLKATANGLTTKGHEWPLPDEQLQAQSTVFELQPPPVFGAWRDASLFLFDEVLKLVFQASKPSYSQYLFGYDGLTSYHTCNRRPRLVLLSETKPHGVTHRRAKSIAEVSRAEICLNHGPRWRYYDNKCHSFLTSFESSPEVSRMCTFQLPPASASLQPFLTRSSEYPDGRDPNEVIAAQSECPNHLSREEFRTLCSLPSGHLLVWMNILSQLAMPSVDWAKIETTLFVTQLSEQAGPGSNAMARQTYSILRDYTFAKGLLENLAASLRRVKQNWESCQAVGIFIGLVGRLLSLGYNIIACDCLDFLAQCREVCLQWMGILRSRASGMGDHDERAQCLEKLLEIALICADTFSVDDQHLRDILDDSENAVVFITCSISIQETFLAASSSCPYSITRLLRWKRLTYRTLPLFLEKVILRHDNCLNVAVKQSWSAYEPGEPWKCVEKCWFSTRTAETSLRSSLPVHFNVLTAELLVNGLPLSRLPSEYVQHPNYGTLFGSSLLEVVPSPVPGLQFSAKHCIHGYEIHLGLHDNGSDDCDLLLHGREGASTRDLIPSRVLGSSFPSSFIDDFVHWYNASHDWIEFCPKDQPWKSSDQHWRLTRVKPNSGWKLTRADGSCMVNLSSETAAGLIKVFQPLTVPNGLHIHHLPALKQTQIHIPALQLSFHQDFDSCRIKSLQYRGMSIRGCQGIGTLVGLKNKLVLCKDDDDLSCLVIVPEGILHWHKSATSFGAQHVMTTVDLNTSTKAQAYQLDRHLGRLVGNASLQSSLFLAYIHAVTSNCTPDPFTSHTGTEAALSLLRSEAVRSFDSLSQENMDILALIENLAPGRRYYPNPSDPMQVVTWDRTLGFTSQHGAFHTEVRFLFLQATRLRFFHPMSFIDAPEPTRTRVSHFLQRDDIRSSTFRIAGFGAESHSTVYDEKYESRDRGQDSTRSSRAFETSLTLSEKRASVAHLIPGGNLAEHLYDLLSSEETLSVSGVRFDLQDLGYDAEWLVKPTYELAKVWRGLSSELGRFNRFQIMMWLATTAFSIDWDQTAVQALLALLTNPLLRNVSWPAFSDLDLSHGYKPQPAQLKTKLSITLGQYGDSPDTASPRNPGESKKKARRRREESFRRNADAALDRAVTSLISQWPCETPQLTGSENIQGYIMSNQAMALSKKMFNVWTQNAAVLEYLRRVCNAIRDAPVTKIAHPIHALREQSTSISQPRRFLDVDALFSNTSPAASLARSISTRDVRLLAKGAEDTNSPRLAVLLQQLSDKPSSRHEAHYLEDLHQSVFELRSKSQQHTLAKRGDDLERALRELRDSAQRVFDSVLNHLMALVHQPQGQSQPPISNARWTFAVVAASHQWPRFSTNLFLRQLNRQRRHAIPSQWKTHLVELGQALTDLQQADRCLQLKNQQGDLIRELENRGNRSWSPFQYPDSLLLEVEGGLRIRSVQEEIACQMRAPPDGCNAVMQLNMGEGKSSVIVPIVAASLADGDKLVRVIVAKPQSKQMIDMLVSKLGGLIGRRIYQMPISRQIKIGEAEAAILDDMCRECMRNGGILLVQPEHLLSFQLMAVDCILTEKNVIGQRLLKTLDFFNTMSRDVVDESDENLSTKFELIYTLGQQRPIDHAPDRWNTIAEVLDLVRRYAEEVKIALPDSVEIDDHGSGRYPRIRVLDDEGSAALARLVARHICQYGLSGFPVRRQPEESRNAVLHYITNQNLSVADIHAVEETGFWTTTTSNTLLLLRGLLARGIVAFAFGQKRWRVNYGLDQTRMPVTNLAVPYRAKDNPTARSEFSHPDSVIILTCLCYYYQGLGNNHLFIALCHLLLSDQASVEYQTWVSDAPELPGSFCHLEGINVQDREQCVHEIFPFLRYSKGAIDYFLSNIVFAKEMKEFPHKLSACGWDIAKVKNHPTTGFSGTNDFQHVLPLSIRQLDLQTQRHTNALVLHNLLSPKNSVALMTKMGLNGVCSSERFLDMIAGMSPEIRVILDVGAQIIELANEQVATAWLGLIKDTEKVQAAVFCNDDDELSVLDRQGRIELLQTSPFAKQLDVCLIFLDEAHTRGIDLRLPQLYRAAVTLGANLTKDRLVQACMRMRKLGTGQTVTFCVSEEIETKIRTTRPDHFGGEVTIPDVLGWTISQTWVDTRRSMAMWATQGGRFQWQQRIWEEAQGAGRNSMNHDLARRLLEDEGQSLDSRYRPEPYQSPSERKPTDDGATFDAITERCQEFGELNFKASTLQEEQERELAPEIEKERRAEHPERQFPSRHSIHENVKTFVETGVIPRNGDGFMWAFEALAHTTASEQFEVDDFPHGLRVTEDFAFTVLADSSEAGSDDLTQRNVHWILTSDDANGQAPIKHMVVISPYEANKLLDRIKASKAVVLHLYAPRQNHGYPPLDHLQLYTTPSTAPRRFIPRRLTIELNIFAGQLYFESFKEYTEFCDFLGLAWGAAEQGKVVRADGFIEPGRGHASDRFKDSPVAFLKVLMSKIRRDCRGGIGKTHVGKVLDGALLTESDFESRREKRKADVLSHD